MQVVHCGLRICIGLVTVEEHVFIDKLVLLLLILRLQSELGMMLSFNYGVAGYMYCRGYHDMIHVSCQCFIELYRCDPICGE